MKNLLLLFSFCAALLLASCATNLPTETVFSSGRFSITSQKKDQVERNSGTYRLFLSSDGTTTLIISGPLGATVATLVQTPKAASLSYSGGKTITAPDSRSLIYNLLGISFSMEQLISLLKGESDSSIASEKFLKVSIDKNENGSIRKINAQGRLSAHEGKFSLILLPNPQ